MANQKGIVLFFALIVLIIMTVIGVALAVNSGQSLRMAGAGSERLEAIAAVHGAIDRAIERNEGASMSMMTADLTETVTVGDSSVQSIMKPMSSFDGDTCRTERADSGIKCRRFEIDGTVKFGRKNMGELTVVVGVEQKIIP